MVSPHRNYLKWSTGCLVLSGYLALASVAKIGPAILLVPLAAFVLAPLGERLDAKYAGYGVVSRAITVAFLCFLLPLWMNFGLMATVVILTIYIQCYTLVHEKSARNYYHLFLMSLFLLLAACVQAPEPVISVVLVVFLVSAVWANIMLRVVLEEERVQKATHVELVSLDYLKQDQAPAGARSQWHALPAMAGSLSMGAIAITALTFVLTPRMEAGILGRSDATVATTGVRESVDLGQSGEITRDETPVMMVQFPDVPGGQIDNPDWLYWRVTTLNEYESNRWRSRESGLLDPGIRGVSESVRDGGGNSRIERPVRPGKRLLRQSVYLDDLPSMGLPVLDLVQMVRLDEDARGAKLSWSGDRDMTVRVDAGGSRRLNYEAWSEVGEPAPAELRGVPMDFSGVDEEDYELFTGQNLSAASVEQARSLTAGQNTLYDMVAAVESYLSGPDFLYTLNAPRVETTSVVDGFLQQTRRGHCEMFASAMALMLRSQGVPTRVVSGYRGGEWNESDEGYTIRASMAHLWVEVWFPGYGWIVFDPSPQSDGSDRSMMDRIGMMVSRIILKSKIFWFREVVGFDRGAQAERLRDAAVGFASSFRDGAERDDQAGRGAQGRGFGYVVPLLALALLGLGGATVLYRLRWIKAPQAIGMTIDQIRAVRLYLLLRRQLQRHDVNCSGKTAEDLADELRQPRWGAPPEALRVLDLYNTVRFGMRSLDGENIARLRRGVIRLRPREVE